MNRICYNHHMASAIETIFYKNKPAAIIARGSVAVDGIKFITEPENALQVGFHQRPKGMKLEPHVHTMEKPVVIEEIQEVLMVMSGSVRLTVYAHTGEVLGKKILKANDCVLLLREGHQIEYLEDTRMFEVKQGPYPGVKNAKIYLNKKS